MSAVEPKRNRWLDWKTVDATTAEQAGNEPTKPSKPGSVGFEGSYPAPLPIIAVEPDEPSEAEIAAAMRLLNGAGVRLMALEGGVTVGVWSDLDRPELRAALGLLGLDHKAWRYLDGPDVPTRYKVRRVPGEPVSLRAVDRLNNRGEGVV